MDIQSIHRGLKELPSDARERVSNEARKEGIFAGLTSGLASALIGSRLMGFNRNKTLVCGVLSGVLAGYYFTQAFTSTALAQLRAEEVRQALATSKHETGDDDVFRNRT